MSMLLFQDGPANIIIEFRLNANGVLVSAPTNSHKIRPFGLFVLILFNASNKLNKHPSGQPNNEFQLAEPTQK